MTNPAQLKYLEAMGIPVWVSRDRIIKDDPVVLNDKQPEQARSNSAESLIASLNAPLNTPLNTSQIPKKQNKVTATRINKPVNVKDSAPNAVIETPKRKLEASSKIPNQIGATDLHNIFGAGDVDADWMVIGQTPDSNESSQSQPFPYESGNLLVNMLRAVGIEQPRQQSYLVNITQSLRSAENIDVSLVSSALNNQLLKKIQQVKPKVLLIVGQLAAQNILETKEPLARLRVQQYQQIPSINRDKLQGLNIPVIVTYHPVYLLSKPQDKAKVWQDLKLAMRVVSDSDD